MNKLNIKLSVFSIVLILSIILSGCARKAMPNDFNKIDNNHSKKGLIIGTISFPNNKSLKWGRYFFHLKFLGEKQSRNSTEIDILNSIYNNSKYTAKYKTYYFAIKRNEGKYEMDNVRLATNGGYVQYYGKFSGFKIPIEVRANKVTYIGQIIYNENSMHKDSVVTIKDNFEEDMNFYKRNNSKIDWNNVIKSQNVINYE